MIMMMMMMMMILYHYTPTSFGINILKFITGLQYSRKRRTLSIRAFVLRHRYWYHEFKTLFQPCRSGRMEILYSRTMLYSLFQTRSTKRFKTSNSERCRVMER